MADATAIFEQIRTALDGLARQIVAIVPQDQTFMEVWGWNLPAINKTEFAEYVRSPIINMDSIGVGEISDSDFQSLSLIPSRIAYFQANALPQLPGGNAFHVYVTAQSLIGHINSILSKYMDAKIDWKDVDDDKILPSAQLRKLRQTERSINKLASDSLEISKKITEINGAHAAAQALPTSLAELSDAKAEFQSATNDLRANATAINEAKVGSETALAVISTLRQQAEKQIQNIDAAYSAATTQGLGKAFGDRAAGLGMMTLVLGCILGLTLAAGAYITAGRIDWVHTLMEKPNVSMSLIWVNVALTVVSVAGPIWFAWLLTKQIGQRFRLAEDYAFKASVAKAYEGYRREASNIDSELEKRLFSLALDRLSEEPLRHVEKQSHGSPLHDIFSALRGHKQPSAPNQAE